MRVKIPDFNDKTDLFAYLKANKNAIITAKKSMPIKSDCTFAPVFKGIDSYEPIETKAASATDNNENVIRVRVVANTANWMDSHSDVLLNDSPKKSISERKKFIPHLHDHIHEVGAKVGEVVDITLENLTLAQLGLTGNRQTQAVVFTTDIMKFYNESVFNQYKIGKVNQHSIGLQYVNLALAMNDENSEEEFKEWNKNIDKVINKEKAMQQGFFWVVYEYKLFENSAVLFGSCEITPTLGKENEPPIIGTYENESVKTVRKNTINFLLTN